MTSLGLTPDTDHLPHERAGDGWSAKIMHAMWAVIILILGYMLTSTDAARSKLIDQVNSDTQRIGVLEEQNRNTRESLQRIENGVYELRQREQERRR